MPNTTDTSLRQLRIWQQNCRKSLENQLHLINSLNPSEYDICLIQEPYIDPFKNTRAPTGWRTIYPPTHLIDNLPTTRSLILVSPRLATSAWMDLRINSPDISALQIWGTFGTILIFNIY